MVNSIVIESDDQFTECEYSPVDDVTSLSREKIIDRIKEPVWLVWEAQVSRHM